MNTFRHSLAVLASALFLILFSANASAFVVWAVNGGAAANSNSAGNVLNVTPGTNTIDLWFDTEGDISWGWDVTLDNVGAGSVTIYNVTGGDINGGLGVPLVDGYQQLGGNAAVDLSGGPILLFSFTYDSVAGSLLALTNASNYTSGNTIGTESITPGNLVATSVVPLPGAAWFMLSGLGALGVMRRKAS